MRKAGSRESGEVGEVYNHLRMCDHKSSVVRLNPSQIFRPNAWGAGYLWSHCRRGNFPGAWQVRLLAVMLWSYSPHESYFSKETWPAHLLDLGCPFGRHFIDFGCPCFLPAAGSLRSGKFQLLEEIVRSILATIWSILLVDLVTLPCAG